MRRSINCGLVALVLGACGIDNPTPEDSNVNSDPDMLIVNNDLNFNGDSVNLLDYGNNPDLYMASEGGNIDLSGLEDIAIGKDLSGMNDSFGDLSRFDLATSHPVAKLSNCNETEPKDGLCIYRTKVGFSFCWDASPSYASVGRKLVDYFIYFDFKNNPQAGIGDLNPKLCGNYNKVGTFLSRLEVTDNKNDTGNQDFYTILTQ